MTIYRHLLALPLPTNGELSFMGITPQNELFIESLEAEVWSQWHLSATGTVLAHANDETSDDLLSLPPHSYLPHPVPLKHPLNYGIVRQHGMREEERASEWVQPLSIVQKMRLIQELRWNVSAMMVFGISHSQVRAIATVGDTEWVVHELGILQALPQVAYDEQRLPYDYRIQRLYLCHPHTAQDDLLMEAWFNGLDGVKWVYPCDCMATPNRFFLADRGTHTIHCWAID